jgi:hypothetical protein
MMSERWWCSVFGIADGYEEVIDQDHPRPAPVMAVPAGNLR